MKLPLSAPADWRLARLAFFSKRGVSFGLETTLSGRGYLKLIRQLKKKGYRVHLFFLFVESVEVTLSRIKERVLKGGHDVPDAVVRRRFDRSLLNFFREYQSLVDSWYLFDNTGTEPIAIAFKNGPRVRIVRDEMFERLMKRYGAQ